MDSVKKYLLVSAPALLLAASAKAQVAPGAISVEIGPAYAMNSDVRDAIKSWGWTAAARYDITSYGVGGASGTPSVRLSYTQIGSGDNKLDTWGLTLDEKFKFSPVGAVTGGTVPYAGLGIGAYRDHARVNVTTSGGSSGTVTTNESESKTRFGGRVFAGVDFSSRMYVEASYNMSGKVFDTKTDTLSLVAGMHF